MSDRSPTCKDGWTRRQFLAGLSGTALAGTILPRVARADDEEGEEPPALEPDKVLGPGAVRVSFTLNGKAAQVDVEPRVTLLDCLRDRLDLTGAKNICDRGACGGCTVLVGGRPVNSCVTLAVDVSGREVVTVEGLAGGEELSAGQAAFVEADALQCGFCTPGMVVSVHALLAANANPTPDEVRHAVSGNLCRCGTYTRVVEAALAAAKRGGRR